MLPELTFPTYPIKLKNIAGKQQVFDEVRKKWVALTPEEWVRQHWINFLVLEKGFPKGLMQVEKSFQLNGLSKRVDLLAGYPPKVLVECKAPDVQLSKATLHQIMRYNLAWQVKWLVLSNGLQHLLYQVDFLQETLSPCEVLPNWNEMD